MRYRQRKQPKRMGRRTFLAIHVFRNFIDNLFHFHVWNGQTIGCVVHCMACAERAICIGRFTHHTRKTEKEKTFSFCKIWNIHIKDTWIVWSSVYKIDAMSLCIVCCIYRLILMLQNTRALCVFEWGLACVGEWKKY